MTRGAFPDILGPQRVRVNGGAPLVLRNRLNLVGARATDDPIRRRIDVSPAGFVTFSDEQALPPIGPGAGNVITATVLSADVNDYNPAGHADASFEVWSRGSDEVHITGLAPSNVERLIVLIGGDGYVFLMHESGDSLEGNRFECPGGADVVLDVGQLVELVYDDALQRWRVLPKTEYEVVTVGSADLVRLGLSASATDGTTQYDRGVRVTRVIAGSAPYAPVELKPLYVTNVGGGADIALGPPWWFSPTTEAPGYFLDDVTLPAGATVKFLWDPVSNGWRPFGSVRSTG